MSIICRENYNFKNFSIFWFEKCVYTQITENLEKPNDLKTKNILAYISQILNLLFQRFCQQTFIIHISVPYF